MMKKNDVIQRLNAGGRILVDSIYRRAQVCDASGENWETMRYDVAERLQHEAGYKVVKTDWHASWYIEKEAQEVTAAEAAEKEIKEFTEFINLLDSEDSTIVPFDVVREIWANASSIKRAVSNVRDYAETIRAEWAAESERVEAATLAALAPMIATKENVGTAPAFLNTSDAQSAQEEEPAEIEEDAAPVYLEERWPESNEAEGIWYTLEYAPGVPTIHHTIEALRAAVHQARHNGRQIKAAWRHDDNTNTRRAIIPETSQEKTDRENWEHCRRISEELEEYAAGMFTSARSVAGSMPGGASRRRNTRTRLAGPSTPARTAAPRPGRRTGSK